MKKVVLIGASGFVGNAILNELLERGHEVTAIVRHPEKVKADNPRLSVVGMDVEDSARLTDVCKGHDAVISAYNPRWGNPDMYEDTLRVYPKILNAVKASGTGRLLIVGGAGSLFVKPGVRLVDTGTLPEAWLPGVKSMAKFYLETLVHEQDLDWVFFSPPPTWATCNRASARASSAWARTTSSWTRKATASFRWKTTPWPWWTNWSRRTTTRSASPSDIRPFLYKTTWRKYFNSWPDIPTWHWPPWKTGAPKRASSKS